ncbi:hypothetical protein BSZ39_01495 [Bowdeniella nasicola]|uniref:DUF3093 domain-containing protein n=1 Tax=Bowdeniella nasicola TaxID=208480 RepID=A0A1Q5Q523_9ACTO|nr:DUF3093 domain-containing protein [Bowdeniella nasicola]OKL54883.1 hypothetical protein BSZ39_01495 [Bowdeniella nasicola]
MCHSRRVTSTRYSSRLYPTVATTIVVVLLAASFGLLFIPVSHALAIIVAVIGGAVGLALLLGSSPKVSVSDGELCAGGAHIPVQFLKDAKILDVAALRHAMGPGADTRAWVVHRPWARSAVKVSVDDPRDPTPYWLVCVKDPHQLVQALQTHEVTGA